MLGLPLEQVQHDWDGCRQRAEQKQRGEKRHQYALALVDRYCIKASSSGSAVVIK